MMVASCSSPVRALSSSLVVSSSSLVAWSSSLFVSNSSLVAWSSSLVVSNSSMLACNSSCVNTSSSLATCNSSLASSNSLLTSFKRLFAALNSLMSCVCSVWTVSNCRRVWTCSVMSVTLMIAMSGRMASNCMGAIESKMQRPLPPPPTLSSTSWSVTVFRERNTVTLQEVELNVGGGGNGRCIFLSIAPMQLEAILPDMAIISVTDITEQVQTRRQLETVQTEQTQLMSELSAANKRLNDVNKELLDANEELQVANEELVLTHEELQASIEEFETTNEELQATNEELETNNEELQATNEELETTNDELRARTGELQELTTTLESERGHLAEMVELAPFYIMVLRGPNLIVEAYNPSYAQILKGRELHERPLEIVFELFWEEGIPIVRAAHEVFRQGITHTTPRVLTRVPNTNGGYSESYFVYTLVPSHDAGGKVSGVIIYAVDETQHRVRELMEERERLRLIFEHSDMAALALYDAQTAELVMGSPRYLDMKASTHNIERDKLTGKKWHELTITSWPDEEESPWQRVIKTHEPLHLPE